MKMPKACIDCSMRDHYGCNLTGKILLDYDFVIGDMVRPDWCPLQEATLVAGMYKTQRGEINE